MLIYALALGYLGFTMYRANQEIFLQERQAGVRALLVAGVILIFLLGVYAVMLAASSGAARELQEQGEDIVFIEVSIPAALFVFMFCLGAATFGLMVLQSEAMRQLIERTIGTRGTYNATSIVHTTAIIFILLIVTANIVLFIIQGGMDAMAASIDSEGIPIGLPALEGAIEVAAAFLGVGFAIRRTLPAALERLGLRRPKRADLLNGVGTAFLLILILIVFGIITTMILPAEQIEEMNKAANSLAGAFATLPAALILSFSAAIGEEILFRGALQPVFGNMMTSVFFVMLHSQSLLTPGMIMLFIFSLTLGHLRNKHSTTAAIIAHFFYNFIQLLSLISVGDMV